MQNRKKRLKALANYHIGDREDYLYAVKAINRGFIESLGDGLLMRQYVRLPSTEVEIETFGGPITKYYKGAPRGLVVVFKYMGVLYICASSCRDGEVFDRDMAFFYATQQDTFLKVSMNDVVSYLPRKCQAVAVQLISEAMSK